VRARAPHTSTPRVVARRSTSRDMSEKSATFTHLKQRRAKIEADAAEIERQVYDLETSLLTDHSAGGNVLKGFEQALAQSKQQTQKKVKPFKTEERVFSISSASSQVVEELAAEAEQIRTTASGRLAKPPTTFK
jgi:chromatin modification-related protein EAF6